MINKMLMVGFALGSASCAYAGDEGDAKRYAEQARLVMYGGMLDGSRGAEETYRLILEKQRARCAAKVPECVDGRLEVIARCIQKSQEGLDKAIKTERTKLIHNAPKQQ